MNRYGDFALTVVVAALVAAGAYMALPRFVATAQVPPPVPGVRVVTPERVLRVRDDWDPIATYDVQDKRLTVTDHLAADALVCIRGACKLAADWR